MRVHSSRTRRLIVLICYYYALAMGITAVRFDFEKRQICSSKLLYAYAACMNAAVVASMPYAYSRCLASMHDYGGNTLLRLTDLTSIVLHLVVIVLTIAYRRDRERRFEGVARSIFNMDERYFKRLPPCDALERRFDCIYFAKFATLCGRVGTTLFATLQMTRGISLETLLLASYFANVQNFIHGVVFHYFGTLWHVCKRFEILNVQLQRLLGIFEQLHVQHMQYGRRSANAELRQIARLHWRLTSLMLELSDGYKYQTLAVLLIYALYNIIYGYYAVLLADGTLHFPLSCTAVLFGALSYGVLLADLYIFYWTCDATASVYRRTSEILKQFQELTTLHVTFERSCEAFSLQLMQRRLHITMGGMFSLNMQTLLALWAYTLRHTLILLQFDYEHRFRYMREHMS